MRVIFGVLSLLVVLAIVGALAKKQLQALGMVGTSTRVTSAASQAGISPEAAAPSDRTVAVPGGMPGAMAGDISGLTVPQQSKALQDKVRDDTVRAMQQSAESTRRRADQN